MRLTTLDREILRSDILRTTILMGFFLLFAVYVGIWAVLAPDDFNAIFTKNISLWSPSVTLLIIALYYFLLGVYLSFCKKRAIFVPLWFQFVTLFLETSIPTLFIYILAQFHPAVYVLLSSRILLYFVFIILSALTL